MPNKHYVQRLLDVFHRNPEFRKDARYVLYVGFLTCWLSYLAMEGKL